MKQDKITRRNFVAGTTGAALSAMIVPRHVLGGTGYDAPSDTVNFALIGCGGQGKTDALELIDGKQNLVALADVDYGFVDREVAALNAQEDDDEGSMALELFRRWMNGEKRRPVLLLDNLDIIFLGLKDKQVRHLSCAAR
jgi:hypothetical protein